MVAQDPGGGQDKKPQDEKPKSTKEIVRQAAEEQLKKDIGQAQKNLAQALADAANKKNEAEARARALKQHEKEVKAAVEAYEATLRAISNLRTSQAPSGAIPAHSGAL